MLGSGRVRETELGSWIPRGRTPDTRCAALPNSTNASIAPRPPTQKWRPRRVLRRGASRRCRLGTVLSDRTATEAPAALGGTAHLGGTRQRRARLAHRRELRSRGCRPRCHALKRPCPTGPGPGGSRRISAARVGDGGAVRRSRPPPVITAVLTLVEHPLPVGHVIVTTSGARCTGSNTSVCYRIGTP